MEKANTLCCNYWSSKGYSYLNKSCLTRLQGPIQSHCNSPDEQSSSYLSITKTNNVTRREWTSSSAQICSPLSKCVTDRQSPKRRESPAIKSTDWPQAMSLQRLEKKKLLGCFATSTFPPGFSVTFWITLLLLFQSLTEAKAWSTFRSGNQPFLYKSRRDNATCPVSAYSWLMMRYHNSI